MPATSTFSIRFTLVRPTPADEAATCRVRNAALCGMLLAISFGHAAAQVQRMGSTAGHSFGFSVSASGDRIAVGAPAEGAGSGAVYVYVFDPAAGWSLEAHLGGRQGEALGSSVALEERYLLTGAPAGGAGAGGAAYLFFRDATGWQEVASLQAPNPGQADAFGFSVALHSIYTMVGAPGRAGSAGALFVFENAGQGGWILKQEIGSGEEGSHFGSSVSLTSEYALIGAPRADEPRGQAAGKAFVFERTGSSFWIQRAVLVAGDARAQSGFGASVSIDRHDLTGTHSAMVGAPFAGPVQAGAAYLFGNPGGLWTQRARYEPDPRAPTDRTGASVVLVEDHYLVGMPGRHSAAGAAVALAIDTTVYAWQERAWHEAAPPQAAARFGHAMAISEQFAVIGAPGEIVTDSTSGAVYVYERPVALAAAAQAATGRLYAYPNPFRTAVTIAVQGGLVSASTFSVFDLLGRRVAVFSGTSLRPEFVWTPGPEVSPGIYGVVVQAGTNQAVHLVTRIR